MSIRLSTTIMYNSCRSMKRHSAVFTHCKIPSIAGRYFQTRSEEESRRAVNSQRPGSVAFADCETDAISDLFYHFAKTHGGVDDRGTYLTNNGVREILKSIGERSDDEILGKLMHVADGDRDGKLYLQVNIHLNRIVSSFLNDFSFLKRVFGRNFGLRRIRFYLDPQPVSFLWLGDRVAGKDICVLVLPKNAV